MKESNGDKRRQEECNPATPLQVNQDGVQGADEPEAPQSEFEQVPVEVVSWKLRLVKPSKDPTPGLYNRSHASHKLVIGL